MKVFKLYLLTILTAFGFGQIDDGCDLPDLNLYLILLSIIIISLMSYIYYQHKKNEQNKHLSI